MSRSVESTSALIAAASVTSTARRRYRPPKAATARAPRLVAVDHDHMGRAVGMGALGERLADAARTAGDDDRLALEFHGYGTYIGQPCDAVRLTVR